MRGLILVIAASAALAGASCNTVAGAGRDVTSVGKKVTEIAR